jgi:Tat protein translocase TatC
MTTATERPRAEREELPRMSFGDHLDELRRRLIRALLAIAVCALGMMGFKNEVTAIYVQPYREMWDLAYSNFVDALDAEVAAAGGVDQLHPLRQATVRFHAEHRAEILAGTFPTAEAYQIELHGFRLPWSLKALGGLEDFWTFMAASMLFALILASPIVLWQAWAFVAAGLYRNEQRVVRRYFPLAVGLLVTGVLFGFFVVVPVGLFFLVQIMNWAQVEPMMSVGQYFSLLFTLTAALGFVFQLPLFMLAAQKVGLVSHDALRKNWRYVILGCFIVAALLTPPDPFTQLLMAVPMTILYLFGLFLTGRSARRGGDAMARSGT